MIDVLLHHGVRKYIICLLLAWQMWGIISARGYAQGSSGRFFHNGRWIANGPEGGTIAVLRIHPAEPHLLFAGTDDGTLYHSENFGEHWTQMTPGLNIPGSRISCLEFYPANPDIMYAGTASVWNHGGLFRSLDRGKPGTAYPAK